MVLLIVPILSISYSNYYKSFCRETPRNFAARLHIISHCSVLAFGGYFSVKYQMYHLPFSRRIEYYDFFSLPAL